MWITAQKLWITGAILWITVGKGLDNAEKKWIMSEFLWITGSQLGIKRAYFAEKQGDSVDNKRKLLSNLWKNRANLWISLGIFVEKCE
jgi:hypothetical protein